jgi:hypothetical protein
LPVRPAHGAVSAALHVGGFLPPLQKSVEIFNE